MGCGEFSGACHCLFPVRLHPMKEPSAERRAIVAFLRRTTHLETLARILEDHADMLSPKAFEYYCQARGIGLKVVP